MRYFIAFLVLGFGFSYVGAKIFKDRMNEQRFINVESRITSIEQQLCLVNDLPMD